jgi:hypothetical protein
VVPNEDLAMSKKQEPFRRPVRDRHHRRGGFIKSGDPPHDSSGASWLESGYAPDELAPTFSRQLARVARDIYILGQYPWAYVILIISYFSISLVWLIEKLSAFNIASVIVSTFVLIYAVGHNFVELIDCFGVIFRHIGLAFKFMGRAFTATGHLFRRTAKRLRETLGDVRHVR